MDAWISAFALVSNWLAKNQPFSFANSTAFWYMPIPFASLGVNTTFAPNILISLRRSTENDSAIVRTKGYPFCAHTIAKPIPVLPDVASTTV